MHESSAKPFFGNEISAFSFPLLQVTSLALTLAHSFHHGNSYLTEITFPRRESKWNRTGSRKIWNGTPFPSPRTTVVGTAFVRRPMLGVRGHSIPGISTLAVHKKMMEMKSEARAFTSNRTLIEISSHRCCFQWSPTCCLCCLRLHIDIHQVSHPALITKLRWKTPKPTVLCSL